MRESQTRPPNSLAAVTHPAPVSGRLTRRLRAELTAALANRYTSPIIKRGGVIMWSVDWLFGVPMLLASVAFQVIGLVSTAERFPAVGAE